MFRNTSLAIRLALLLVLVQFALSLTGIVSTPYADLLNAQAVVGLSFLVALFYLLHLCCGFFSYTRQWTIAIVGALFGALLLNLIERSSLPALSSLRQAYVIAGGMGLVALGSFFYQLRCGNSVDRDRIRLMLGTFAAVACVLATVPAAGIKLTLVLHPRTFDAVAYHFDQALAFQPSVIAALIGERFPAFGDILLLAYNLLPWGFPILFAYLQRGPNRGRFDLLGFWLLSGAVAWLTYHIVPVAGPRYAFGEAFPFNMPTPDQVRTTSALVMPAARNGIPSMHFGWALAFWLVSHLLDRTWLRNAFAIFLGMTVLATLTLGEHYAIDLLVSVPLILATYAACLKGASDKIRRQTIFFGGGLFACWLLFVRLGVVVAQSAPSVVLLAEAATLISCGIWYRRLMSSFRVVPAVTDADPSPLPVRFSAAIQLAGVFALSGFAALVYEVVFSKELALAFGSTALATYTVLATYMGGIALGSWIGGWLAQKTANPLRAYIACELVIGAYCVLTPFLFRLTQGFYLSSAGMVAPDAAVLTLQRFGLGAAVLLVPTLLMGMTLPLLVRFLGERQQQLGVSVAILYGANTLGAGLGALLCGYAILPTVGVRHATLLAAALNLIAAFIVIQMHKRRATVPESTIAPAPEASSATTDVMSGRIALVVLGLGGVVTLVLETDYIHLLAVVAGNSAYAFSLMLATFLSGLALGGLAAKRLMTRLSLPALLAWLEYGLAAVLLLGIFAWEQIPLYLSDYASYPAALTFPTREFVRGAVCALAMLPPTLFIGAIYPVALQCVAQAFPRQKFAMLGRAMAINTAGNIVGVILGGFVLLPMIGALRSIHMLAAASVSLALLALVGAVPRQRLVALAPLSVVLALALIQPLSFDYGALASGANVYFAPRNVGKVIDHAESLDGGVTTVAVNEVKGVGRIKTLMTNGKFQGNDAMTGEMKAQVGFALAPLLHVAGRERALVIGYGTGVTARTLYDAGFTGLDIAELSADIVTMSNRHFSDINHSVSDQPGVRAYITDGRNFLMMQPQKYDLITIEITSIWFAGAASLYNREFYQLAKTRLKPGGVLQQWVQLHHMRGEDFLTIMATLRSEFRYVWVYLLGGQGVVVAANDAGAFPSTEKLDALAATQRLRPLLAIYGGDARALSQALYAKPDAIDRLVAEAQLPFKYLVSTDDNLRLEYDTPKGNVLNYDAADRITSVLRDAATAAARGEPSHLETVGGDYRP